MSAGISHEVRQRGRFVVRVDDPDRPFEVDAYVAIRSWAEFVGPAVVEVGELPYGMWWDELRPHIELHRGSGDCSEAIEPVGVWCEGGQHLAVDHDGYDAAIVPFLTADWLDESMAP